MNRQEDIYNQALEMMRQGASEKEVLLMLPEKERAQLAPLLSLSTSLLSMPKMPAPRPMMQRKYAAAKQPATFMSWFRVSKFAISAMAVVFLLSAFGITAYAARNSVPGQPLFALKKSEEQTQLYFATSQSQRANLQLAIAQSRLSEAQMIFSDPSSNPQQQNAALNELADQTSSAVAEVSTVTQSNPQSTQDHPLINSLSSLTQAQAQLLTQIKPDSQTLAAHTNAIKTLTQSDAQLSQIQQTVAAANSSQTLAQLNNNPDSLGVYGDISEISAFKITVDKNTFNIDPETSITDINGNPLQISELSAGERVNIVGLKGENSLTAQVITVALQSNPALTALNASASSTQSTSSLTTLTTASTTTGTVTSILQSTSTPSTTPAAIVTPTPSSTTTSSDVSTTPSSVDPNVVTGSAIYDSPLPQYGN